jgi:hypothetical protein
MLRVRVTENMSVYWNYQPISLAEGEEVSGEAAIYLARTGAPVEIIEGELPDEPATLDVEGGEPTGGPHLLPGNTIAEVMSWVNDDPDRARQVLEVELAREKPRATLVAKLEPLADKTDEPPAGSEPGAGGGGSGGE